MKLNIDKSFDELEEQNRREIKREVAEGIRAALIEYLRACEEKPPELLAAIEFLQMEIQRLSRDEGGGAE